MLLRHASLALAAGLALGVPAAAAAPDTTPVAAEHVTAPVTASSQDSAGYAQREQKDHKVADYQGGDVVLITASGGAIIVLLLLLLILV